MGFKRERRPLFPWRKYISGRPTQVSPGSFHLEPRGGLSLSITVNSRSEDPQRVPLAARFQSTILNGKRDPPARQRLHGDADIWRPALNCHLLRSIRRVGGSLRRPYQLPKAKTYSLPVHSMTWESSSAHDRGGPQSSFLFLVAIKRGGQIEGPSGCVHVTYEMIWGAPVAGKSVDRRPRCMCVARDHHRMNFS